MDAYLARQPIFDKYQNVFGYEILYRDSNTNCYLSDDPDKASCNVMLNSFNLIGIENLTAGKKAFINFTENLLEKEVATLFSRENLVIEILETVKPSKEIVDSCKELKKQGYTLALDDFIFQKEYIPLIEIADIIKIDFLATPKEELKSLTMGLKPYNTMLLAEKIETYKDFENAKEWGYSLFQGYFFSKPIILSIQDIPPLKINYLQLLQKINEDAFNFNEIAEIISRDISLSYKLLRLVNSVAFGLRNKIKSVKHALVILGTKEVKKWITLIAIKGIEDGQNEEIIRISLIRAKFMEQLSKDINNNTKKDEMFLTGLFSTLDILMNRPVEEILKDINLSNDIVNALLHKDGIFTKAFELILSYENADWDNTLLLAENLNIDISIIVDYYLQALKWGNEIENEIGA